MALFNFLKRRRVEAKRQRGVSPRGVDSSAGNADKKELNQGQVGNDFSLIAPHITERSRELTSRGAYVFKVHDDSTKKSIARSVENFYKVHVEAVRILIMPSKPRRRGLTAGTKKGYKKAIVTLKEGDKIELF